MLNTRRKFLVAFSLVLTLLIAQGDLARAIVWRFGPSEVWDRPDGTGMPFSPTHGEAYTRSWTRADEFPGFGYYIDAWWAGFWFSSARISYIQGMYAAPDRRFFTADTAHSLDCDTTVNVEAYSTDVPNAHFDLDNDPEPQGCGYNDEGEITVVNPAPLTAFWSYNFLTVWHDMTNGNTADYLQANSQKSYEHFSGEYDTDPGYFDLLATPNYDTRGLWGSLASQAYAAEPAPTAMHTEAAPAPLPTNLAEYRALMLARQREIGLLWRGSLDVNVTFKALEPLDVISAMRAAGLDVYWFDAVGRTSNGRTTTLGTRVDDSGVQRAVLTHLLEVTDANLLGTYSVRGRVAASTLATLQQDERVDIVGVPSLQQLQTAAATGRTAKPPHSAYLLR